MCPCCCLRHCPTCHCHFHCHCHCPTCHVISHSTVIPITSTPNQSLTTTHHHHHHHPPPHSSTDVEELHQWHVAKTTAHPYFQRLTDDELRDDPAVTAMCEETEESKKVSRIGGRKYHAVFRRRHESELAVSMVESLFSEES